MANPFDGLLTNIPDSQLDPLRQRFSRPRMFGQSAPIQTNKFKYTPEEIAQIQQQGTLDTTPAMDPGREALRLPTDVLGMIPKSLHTGATGFGGATMAGQEFADSGDVDKALAAGKGFIDETRQNQKFPWEDKPSLPFELLDKHVVQPLVQGLEDATGNTGFGRAGVDFLMQSLPLLGLPRTAAALGEFNTRLGEVGAVKVPKLFSQARKVVDEKLPPTIKGQSLPNILQKYGVTNAEMSDLGIKELAKKDRVTKEEILEHIDKRGLKVGEDVLGKKYDIDDPFSREKEKFKKVLIDNELGEDDANWAINGWRNSDPGAINSIRQLLGMDQANEWFYKLDNAAKQYTENLEKAKMKDTQYSNYKAIPGDGDEGSYREGFVTGELPKQPSKADQYRSQLNDVINKRKKLLNDISSQNNAMTPEQSAELRRLEDIGEELTKRIRSDRYDSAIETTWKDPHHLYDDVKNPIARYRYDIKTLPDGRKVMRVHEIQQGFRSGEKNVPEFFRDATYDRQGNETMSGGGKWKDLVTKQILAAAKEEGVDGITWSTGEQQRDLYNNALRQVADEARYNPETQELSVLKNGQMVQSYPQKVPVERLEDHIGKDAARKLLESKLGGEDQYKYSYEISHGGTDYNLWEGDKPIGDDASINHLFFKAVGDDGAAMWLEQTHPELFNEIKDQLVTPKRQMLYDEEFNLYDDIGREMRDWHDYGASDIEDATGQKVYKAIKDYLKRNEKKTTVRDAQYIKAVSEKINNYGLYNTLYDFAARFNSAEYDWFYDNNPVGKIFPGDMANKVQNLEIGKNDFIKLRDWVKKMATEPGNPIYDTFSDELAKTGKEHVLNDLSIDAVWPGKLYGDFEAERVFQPGNIEWDMDSQRAHHSDNGRFVIEPYREKPGEYILYDNLDAIGGAGGRIFDSVQKAKEAAAKKVGKWVEGVEKQEKSLDHSKWVEKKDGSFTKLYTHPDSKYIIESDGDAYFSVWGPERLGEEYGDPIITAFDENTLEDAKQQVSELENADKKQLSSKFNDKALFPSLLKKYGKGEIRVHEGRDPIEWKEGKNQDGKNQWRLNSEDVKIVEAPNYGGYSEFGPKIYKLYLEGSELEAFGDLETAKQQGENVWKEHPKYKYAEKFPVMWLNEKTPSSFPIYEGMTGVLNMLQDQVAKNGGGAKGVALTAAKVGVPAAIIAKFLSSDDEGRKKMMKLPVLAGLIYGANSRTGKILTERPEGHQIGQYSELGDRKMRIPMGDYDARTNTGRYSSAWGNPLDKWDYDHFKNGVEFPLGKILLNETLYYEYPGARGIGIRVSPYLNGSNGQFRYYPGTKSGQITIKPIKKGPKGDIVFADTGHSVVPTILHEVQHFIQHVEDFATGGSPERFMDYLTPSEKKGLAKAIETDDYETINFFRSQAWEIYRELQGEEEARRVASEFINQNGPIRGNPFKNTDVKNPKNLRVFRGLKDDQSVSKDIKSNETKLGQGWWLNHKTGKLVGFDTSVLHDDYEFHRDMITVGDHAEQLGLTPKQVKAAQKWNDAAKIEDKANQGMDVSDDAKKYMEKYGESYEDNAYEEPNFDDIIRIRKWPSGHWGKTSGDLTVTLSDGIDKLSNKMVSQIVNSVSQLLDSKQINPTDKVAIYYGGQPYSIAAKDLLSVKQVKDLLGNELK